MNELKRKSLFAGLLLAGGMLVSSSVLAVQVPGTGGGTVADGAGGVYGTPLVVSFAVAGQASDLSTVAVQIDMTHSWAGDLDVVLAAPGGSPNLVVVSRIGAVTAAGAGDSSNYNGVYNFADGASGTNIWTVATTGCDGACDIAAGDYRTTAGGGAGQVIPAPTTSLVATFAGLTAAQANGTWTLTFRDRAGGDLGTVNAATLYIDESLPVELQDFSID